MTPASPERLRERRRAIARKKMETNYRDMLYRSKLEEQRRQIMLLNAQQSPYQVDPLIAGGIVEYTGRFNNWEKI